MSIPNMIWQQIYQHWDHHKSKSDMSKSLTADILKMIIKTVFENVNKCSKYKT